VSNTRIQITAKILGTALMFIEGREATPVLWNLFTLEHEDVKGVTATSNKHGLILVI
jgi:hypothetical protein